MSQVIQQESIVFFQAVCHGVVLTFLYDLLRAVRGVFKHGMLALAAEDFFFWIAAAFLTFCFAFLRTDGIVRGYIAAGIILGAVFYHVTVSRYMIRIFSAVFYGIWRVFRKIRRILSGPVEKMVVFIRKKGYNKRTKEE